MNNIELSTIYLPMLDEVYQAESKTSILDGDETTVQKGNNGEIKIAKLSMDALGDFDRASGYTKGSTSFVWETVKYDKERSQDLRIDRLDNEEALAMPFAKLSSEFLRTKVIPETDAARIAKLCSASGITTKAETLDSGEDVVAALRACTSKMDEDEVPAENRILFITPTLKGAIDDLDTTKSKKVLEKFSTIIEVPSRRMYTAITLKDGKTGYGYTKAEAAKDVNFLCVEKSAAVTAMDQYIKYFTPDQDQEGDSHVFKYRNNNLYGHVYENKTAGIYVSHTL
ncbi:hypothetical protein SAMN02746066_04082 [Anaerosporobacter mobilis DSM 15930]|jgi:hypothetical protein|uniref:Major capsid protein, N4-gp56 family n=1 Tax=Anaerosporobacter mobilis DSM 15930 TaxID=1120996 RepID=A0A1M7MX36_9FIRM|nr:hypothetical protein [Anaerosporobacter mobilis]SHM95613.1 hypothetical protein SAMN02746066_04082 [Anaerosporobacter mobilis DSM 15930]